MVFNYELENGDQMVAFKGVTVQHQDSSETILQHIEEGEALLRTVVNGLGACKQEMARVPKTDPMKQPFLSSGRENRSSSPHLTTLMPRLRSCKHHKTSSLRWKQGERPEKLPELNAT